MNEPSQVIEGFLVLELPGTQRGVPPVYRGLYRLPPFLLDDWHSDPYMIHGLTDAGFFATREDAEAARGTFMTMRPGGYEIVFATTDLSVASTGDLDTTLPASRRSGQSWLIARPTCRWI